MIFSHESSKGRGPLWPAAIAGTARAADLKCSPQVMVAERSNHSTPTCAVKVPSKINACVLQNSHDNFDNSSN